VIEETGENEMSVKQLTFGKYSGKTALEVAMIDSGYAIWAANNLKSSMWQAEFSSALKQINSGAVAAEVIGKARYNEALQSDTGREMDHVSAKSFVEEAAEELNERAAYNKMFADYANKLGTSVDKLKSIYNKFQSDVKASAFSSSEKYDIYMKFCQAHDDHCNKYF
jgi:hypothetical protein